MILKMKYIRVDGSYKSLITETKIVFYLVDFTVIGSNMVIKDETSMYKC